MPKPIRLASALLAFAPPLLAAVLLLPGAASAAEDCQGTLSQLPLMIGADPTWVGTMEGESYRLSNIKDPNAIETIYVDPRDCRVGSLDIAVEVKLEEAGQGLGGLIYARVPEPLSYLTLVVTGDGAVRLYSRGPAGLEPIAQFKKAKLLAGGFNTLRIVEGPGQFEAFVNGDRVGTAKTDLAGTGAVGILAGGKGEFLFRNFAIVPVGPPAAAAATTGTGAAAVQPADPAAADAAAGAASSDAPAADTAGAGGLPLPPTPPASR